eukprot:1194641-Prorocentrum_minimum.AAC.1
MTRQLARKGPRGGLQAGRTDIRSAVAGECRDPDGGAQTIPNQTAACTQTETQPTAWVPRKNTRDFPEDVGRPDCMGKPEARWLRAVGKFVSRRGEAGLAESALPASPSSQEG